MKKLLKILIVLIIIFIVIISGIYYFKSHRKFKFTITDINNDSITGAYLIPDTQTVEYSSFNFYNENGQKLEFSDLSVGNIVYCRNLKDYCFERNKISEIEDDRISLNSFYLNYYSFRASNLNKTALIMSQTGGGCRATNYIGFIRKALKDAGFSNVPVISFNVVGMEKMPGFKLTPKMIERMIKCVLYADLLQKMLTKNRAYEINKGETQKLFDEWMIKCKKLVRKSSIKEFKQSIYDIVNDFEKIELDTTHKKPKVGIVGEVLIKYHPFGNNFAADMLEKEGAEVILPDFMGFVKFMATHKITFNTLIKTDKYKSKIFRAAIKLIDILEKDERIALANSKKGYLQPCDIWELEGKVKDVLSIGNQTGEGWFLTAEMIEYIEHGIPNIVCVQPFACLPNHVVGKGVIKTIRNKFPYANISPVDYDPGASEANQTNRIKLLMAVAKDNLKAQENEKIALESENLKSEIKDIKKQIKK